MLYEAIGKDENTSTMGAVAALRALEQAQISPLQVRYILVATNSQEQIYPPPPSRFSTISVLITPSPGICRPAVPASSSP